MKNILVFALFFVSQIIVFAHGEDTNGQKKPDASEYFTLYAQSQKYELTFRYPELVAGIASELTLYLADFDSNQPLEKVEIKVSAQEDSALQFEVEAHEPGVYHITVTFPQERAYSLAVQLNSESKGADLLLLKSVEVGKKLPKPEPEAAETGSFPVEMVLTLAVGILIGLILMFFLGKNPRTAATLLVLASIPATFQHATAHGSDGHGDEKGESSFGNSLFIPKETQFLFDLLTKPVVPGDFTPSIRMYGTIVPSPGGFANVSTPQNGKVIALKTSPGQKVVAGQVVAVLKPSVSQPEQLGVVTETGRMQVEIEAAQLELITAGKERTRLRAIADIAAKKDVQAAEARFDAAQNNLDALNKLLHGSITSVANGNIVLKAPVGGTVGQFTLAPGAEVAAGTVLFSITSLSKVFVEAQVYDRDAEVVKNAGKYTLSCSNNEHKTAQVRLVSAAQEVNPNNQAQKVLFEMDNAEGDFKIGEFVNLEAFRQKSDRTLFVPNSSLAEINGKPIVFIKDGPEMYTVSYVATGENNGSYTVVTKGIEEGERIVSTGTYQMKMIYLNQ